MAEMAKMCKVSGYLEKKHFVATRKSILLINSLFLFPPNLPGDSQIL